MSTEQVVYCSCQPDREAPLKVCQSGNNNGEPYWACTVRKENGGCGFFRWQNPALNNKRPRTQYNQSQFVTRTAPIPPPVSGAQPTRPPGEEMSLLLLKDLIDNQSRRTDQLEPIIKNIETQLTIIRALLEEQNK